MSVRFLKEVQVNTDVPFRAILFNDRITEDKTIADFFMAMMDQEQDVEGAKRYIKMGRMIDPFKPWDEIEGLLE